MNDITVFPADIAEMSVSQLAALPPDVKREVDKNLDAAIDWLKKARTKFDAALDQCYGEQARVALSRSATPSEETCASVQCFGLRAGLHACLAWFGHGG